MDAPNTTLLPAFTFPQVKVDCADDVAVDASESANADDRPALLTHMSEPSDLSRFPSPLRHHMRTPSQHREVKETLNAQTEFSSEDADGRTHHRVNQYTLLEEIGRGSFGAVHLATDQFGNEFAVKEFSKARLRRQRQSLILRQGPRGPRRTQLDRASSGSLFGAPFGAEAEAAKDALHLIREEIAIMKKLNHPNVVQLIEVLDDPEEDSLYMVLEMCKKGVVMKVGLDENADPYSEETCRYWFRDLILGIEYLHAQGVIHRDIKPDNLLLSDDEVLKVVDFGVSEIFQKPDNMTIQKSAGSPAFLPPELCGKHGHVSGRAADIWSMGVSLFCLKYGRIPFNRDGVLEMYDAIKSEEPFIPEGENLDFVDLIKRLLEKNPEERIKIGELREHAWVTKGGTDPLLTAEENCVNMVEPPSELEVGRAFTRKMNHLICVMKAIHRFRGILLQKRSQAATKVDSMIKPPSPKHPASSFDPAEEIEALVSQRRNLLSRESNDEDKGHARSVSERAPLYLGIGTSSKDDFTTDESSHGVVSDSPTAVDFNVYDTAYEKAIEQIKMNSDATRKPTMYLTKFVKAKDHFKMRGDLVGSGISTPDNEGSDKKGTSLHVKENLTQLASKIDLASSEPGEKEEEEK